MVSRVLLGVLSLLWVVCAEARVFTEPIHSNVEGVAEWVARREGGGRRVGFEDVLELRGLRRRSQVEIGGAASSFDKQKNKDKHKHGRVDVEDSLWPNPYIVPAALGTPPQPFRLLLDLAWDTLFIPSADCTGDCSGEYDRVLKFWANRSSTYVPVTPDVWLIYGTDRFYGSLGRDKFFLGGTGEGGGVGVEVHEQWFMLADGANPLGFVSFYYGYDGVLGLAPRFDHPLTVGDGGGESADWERASTPSPWSMMVNQSLLEKNLFALELPSGPMRVGEGEDARLGEISFGGISEKYADSEFEALPLSEFSDQVWAVEAQSLTWENETHPIHEEFVNLTLAGFDTTAWFIGLPDRWVKRIYRSVEHQCGFLDCVVDCSKRKVMPDLTFGIAGKKLRITAFDYTVEVVAYDGQQLCLFDLVPTDGQFPVDAIVLGRGFMEAFYSVFDLDEREVRLTRRIN